MNRALLSAVAIAGVALAAACSGGGSGGTGHPATVPAPLISRATATGKVVLTIPNATPATTARKPQYISSGANSATLSLNGGAATVYDLTAQSSNCAVTNSVRSCSLPITAPSGPLTVSLTLYATSNASGTPLGSATGSTTVNAPTPFTVTIDVNPNVTALAGNLTFPTGLGTISYRQGATGTLSITFDDAAGVPIPSTNTSTFQTPITITSSDPHVTLSPSTVTSAAQTVNVVYDGSALVNLNFTITMKSGNTTLATLPLNVAGYLFEYPTTTSNSGPSGIAVGSDGAIWFTEYNASKIGRVNFPAPYTGTPTISEYPTPYSSEQPYAIAAGPLPASPSLWYSDEGGYTFGEINVPPSPAPQETNAPPSFHGVVGYSGAVWFADNGNQLVQKVNPATMAYSGSASLPGCNAEQITVGPDGFLWVTCSNANTLWSIDPANLASPTSYAINAAAAGITAGPDGAMWFCETTANKIGRISIPGHVYSEAPIATAASAPFGIALGGDGGLWFTQPGINKIGRIDPTTLTVSEFLLNSTSPENITAGQDGWLWFTENTGSTIGRMQAAS